MAQPRARRHSKVVEIPTEAARVADYVRRVTDCAPGKITLIDKDPRCRVWRVTIAGLGEKWTAEGPRPPKCWYICSGAIMSAYRSTMFNLEHVKGVSEITVVDLIKTFHIGLMVTAIQAKAGAQQ